MSSNKEMQEIRRELRRKGWRVEKGGKHFKCFHPEGGRIIMSISPRGIYAPNAARRDIEELEEFNRRKRCRTGDTE